MSPDISKQFEAVSSNPELVTHFFNGVVGVFAILAIAVFVFVFVTVRRANRQELTLSGSDANTA